MKVQVQNELFQDGLDQIQKSLFVTKFEIHFCSRKLINFIYMLYSVN